MQPSSEFREAFEVVEEYWATDENGDQKKDGRVLYKGFARVSNLASREFWDAAALGSERVVKLFCRWHPALDLIDVKKTVIKWRSKRLGIVSVDNVDSRNDQVIIRAKEVS